MGWFGLNRGVAQLASVPRLGRGGREFESHHPDMSNLKFRILVYLLLGTGVLAAGLVINRPNSGQLEAIEAASTIKPRHQSCRPKIRIKRAIPSF